MSVAQLKTKVVEKVNGMNKYVKMFLSTTLTVGLVLSAITISVILRNQRNSQSGGDRNPPFFIGGI